MLQAELGHENRYWLGAHDLVHEGDWVWEHTGHPLNFTAWNPSHPDGGTAGNCMYFYFGYSAGYTSWSDGDCEGAGTMRPLCKAPFKPTAL